MGEWKEMEIQEGLIDIIDYRGKTPPKSNSGITLISAANVKGGDLDFTKTSFISENNYKAWTTRGFTKPGDVLITTEAPAGEVALLPDNKTYQISRRVIALRTDEKKLHSEFLYFALLDPRIKAELLSASRGSTVPRLLKTDITQFKILTPNYDLQVRTVKVLGAIKAKIDLLHRQNKTLEAMAETLFRQWFVEEAQVDWEEFTLGSLINISSGKGLKKELISESGIYPVLGANGEIGRTNDFLFDESLLFTGRVGTLGNVFRVENEKVWLSDNTLVIRPKNYFNFIYFVLKTARLEKYNVGSTQPLIRQSDIKKIEIRLPKEKKLHKFEKESALLFNKILQNKSQINTLEKLRDTLLPKLMSGEVRVSV